MSVTEFFTTRCFSRKKYRQRRRQTQTNKNITEATVEELRGEACAVPVDIEGIARGLGILVSPWEPVDRKFTGALLNMPAGRTVYYSIFQNFGRRRFTVAHELGHHVLHEGREFYCPNADYMVEREANAFAAALLMPPKTVQALWCEYRHNPGFRVENIAAELLVSKEALGYRIKELRLY